MKDDDAGSIDWGSDEDPFSEAAVTAAAAEADAHAIPSTLPVPAAATASLLPAPPAALAPVPVLLPAAQAAPSVLPWWVALTGLDARVQAAVAAEPAKLGEVTHTHKRTFYY